jgi:hypothetical protein
MDQENDLRSPKRIARYEIIWEREETLPEEIKKAWEAGKAIQNIEDVAKGDV